MLQSAVPPRPPLVTGALRAGAGRQPRHPRRQRCPRLLVHAARVRQIVRAVEATRGRPRCISSLDARYGGDRDDDDDPDDARP